MFNVDFAILLPRLPNVDNTTPRTIPANEMISSLPNCSIPHSTATEALVNGSAALTVSTNAALPDLKPWLVIEILLQSRFLPEIVDCVYV